MEGVVGVGGTVGTGVGGVVGIGVGGVVGTGVFPGVDVLPEAGVGDVVGVELRPDDGTPPDGALVFVEELFVLVGRM